MLRFDAWQRYTQVSEILREAFAGRSRSVLDVGGGTGQSLELPENWIQTCVDIHPAGVRDFVQGSADQLPFRDSSIDIVVCLDTLEHLPVDCRDPAVAEMMRVASEAVLIAGPFEDEDVCAAERTINNLHRRLTGQPHPWLAEHLAATLPELDRVEGLMLNGCVTVYRIPCGYLPAWLLLMMMGQVLDTRSDSTKLAEDLDRVYRERIYPFDQMEPAYRFILIGLKSGVDTTDIPSPEGDFARLSSGLCEAISQMASTLGSSSVAEEEAPDQVDVDVPKYTKRLEDALESWEVACGEAIALAEKGHRRMAELERRRSFRIYRRIMALFGRAV